MIWTSTYHSFGRCNTGNGFTDFSQIIIDEGPVQSRYLRRVLVDLCRHRFRTGVLSSFYFASAVAGGKEKEDNEELNEFCSQVCFLNEYLSIRSACTTCKLPQFLATRIKILKKC
jgi:hypothetical protein